MQSETTHTRAPSHIVFQAALLLPVFLTIESTRAALWAARAVDEPDHDGPLLRALFAFLLGVLAVVPSPAWTVFMYVAWVAWVPVRGVLWVWGIGRRRDRDGPSWGKRSPKAVTRWYAYTRARRAETLRRQRRRRDSYE